MTELILTILLMLAVPLLLLFPCYLLILNYFGVSKQIGATAAFLSFVHYLIIAVTGGLAWALSFALGGILASIISIAASLALMAWVLEQYFRIPFAKGFISVALVYTIGFTSNVILFNAIT